MNFKQITSLSVLAAAAMLAAAPAQAALVAGDIAIISQVNNTSPDTFAFVALANIAAGEVVYFTDNGWTGSAFRGASGTDADGNEGLTKWTAAANVAAGTIVLSNASSFATSGAIGGASGNYSSLALTTTEQIYAFQSSVANPLLNPSTHLYALANTAAFVNSTSSATGGIATGLELGKTAVALGSTAVSMHVKNSLLAGPAKSKDEWLAVFGDKANWETGALSTSAIAVTAVPEPSTYALLLAGLGAVGFVARRRKV